jgi:enediyne biosynthesis protein E4
MLDLIEVNRRLPVTVWRNVGWGDPEVAAPMGHWLGIRLEQGGGNRDAIGAWIEVKIGEHIVTEEVTVGGGHAGGQLGWIHFGLGSAGRAAVRVQWPDGELGPWMTIDADARVTIERSAKEPTPWMGREG